MRLHGIFNGFALARGNLRGRCTFQQLLSVQVGKLVPEDKERAGILISVTSRKLQSFGHKCTDDECGPKASEKAWPQGEGPDKADQAPSFFQMDQAMQPIKGVDEEVAQGAEVDTQHTMPEVSREEAAAEVAEVAEAASPGSGIVRNASLLQLQPGKISASVAPAADDKEVLEAMRQAVATLEAKESQAPANGSAPTNPAVDTVVAAMSAEDGHSVVDVATPAAKEDPVLKALEDGVGAQDPTFNENRSQSNGHLAAEDPVLAALRDNVGAKDPALNGSAPVQAAPAEKEPAQLPADAKRPSGQSELTMVAPGLEHRGFWSTRSGALAAAVGFVAATWLAVICLATGFWMAVTTGWRCASKGNVRSAVEALRRCTAADVEKLTRSEGGYDCNFSKPISSKRVLRLEVQVEGAEQGEALTAPLTGHSCVLHSAAVSKQLHDGMPAVPIAFSASSVDFVVSLLDNPESRIVVRGRDVSLFDTVQGRFEEATTFGAAQDNWQDFVLTHRSAAPQGREWAASSSLRADDAILEFQECSLRVGSVVTVVGELHRGADGQLTLRPWQGEEVKEAFRRAKKSLREPWRTSWEGGEEKQNIRLAPSPNILRQKVFISDDEGLLQKDAPDVDGKLRECATGFGTWMG
ncbi:unnamed protein product [Symbiodinium natans]|uniref:Uncharacterized protein n=1 Tax=Symbiodinium natans TaxID=878477 RepID=A0A812UK01_9DINO|nr:unnamed protein product [Symbiodinium natans]